MSNAPHSINTRKGQTLEEVNLVDTMIKDGLWDAFNNYHMGMTAENVATKWNIRRKDQDEFALFSQQKNFVNCIYILMFMIKKFLNLMIKI